MAKDKKTQPAKSESKPVTSSAKPALFERQNYLILLGGMALMVIGFLLMTGGEQPSDKWDPNDIYSFRRITLSTIVVVLGLGVVMVSIFWKKKEVKVG